jgi:hypothetical protein
VPALDRSTTTLVTIAPGVFAQIAAVSHSGVMASGEHGTSSKVCAIGRVTRS